MMNNGLPSLLDAIFGKQDLDSVSLEEMYELISEFPSFNAGHFLLSKKLKQQNEAAYEKETMRTALYFNNPFWLQSVLNEEDYPEIAQHNDREYSSENGAPISMAHEPENNNPPPRSELEVENTELTTVQFLEHEESVDMDEIAEPAIRDDKIFEDITEKQYEFTEAHPTETVTNPEIFAGEEPSPMDTERPVKSFDDLISKYNIVPRDQDQEIIPESRQELEIPPADENLVNEQAVEDSKTEPADFPFADGVKTGGEPENIIPEGKTNLYEIREEIFNEYGIFEEVIVKKQDSDQEAFDRPHADTSIPDEKPGEIHPATEASEEKKSEEPDSSAEFPKATEENLIEIPDSDQLIQKQAEADYEAFDRPIDKREQEETPDESAYQLEISAEEESITEIYSGRESRMESVEIFDEPDDTGDGGFTNTEGEYSGTASMPGLADRYSEHKKTTPPFDPKKAESIVFAPYHMIDYFASQGIKLVMEENPKDPFGKQLKSFTDWLKVMKKLPAQTISEKPDEKEVDRIRHFAAHSIDEKEILTESMAEVLAKQGMYENAIALYQKLSLIYPPKSAYFASRIEQLKASLP